MSIFGRAVASWRALKDTVRLTDDAAKWRRMTGKSTGENWAGRPVTVETALQLSPAMACVRLNAETVATLPIGVFERNRDGSRAPADHRLYEIIHDSPNADQTAVEYWEGQVAALCLWGNAYSEKVMSASGDRLVSLQPLPAGATRPYRTSDGALRYRFTDRGKMEDVPQEKMFHIRGFGLGGDIGLSPIAYARHTIGIASATEEAAGRTFGQGLRATGIFTTPPGMNDTQRKAFHENFVKPAEGAENEGKQIIMPPGFDWKAINIPPKDAEMLLSRRHSIEEICRWFRVPPVLIGHSQEGQTMWGSGIEQIMIGWLTLGLRTYLKRIEAAIQKQLFLATERSRFFAEFNVEGLLRADSAARASFLSTLVQNGLLTRNEARALDNRPPLPGGEVLTVQSNLLPLDQLGEAQADAATAVRRSLLDWLREDVNQPAAKPKFEVVK